VPLRASRPDRSNAAEAHDVCRIARCTNLPSFQDHPEAFEIVRCEINRDEWAER
jgi:hypothetical protein